MTKKITSLLLVLTLPLCVWAKTDLTTALKQAVQSDPTFSEAKADYLSFKERRPQAIAQALFNINASGEISYTKQLNTSGFGNSFAPTNKGMSYSVELAQPVVDFAKWIGIAQANEEVRYGQAKVYAAYQDLIMRTAKAYFTVLAAKDTLAFSQAEKKANKRQLERTKQRHKVGLDAITSVHNAQAAYDRVVAQEIKAINDLDNVKESLTAISGEDNPTLCQLNKQLPLKHPHPHQVNRWIEQALKENFTLKAAKYEVGSFKHRYRQAAAAHLPTLNAIGYITHRESRTDSFGLSKLNTAVGALRLRLPLFESGFTQSRVRQAAQNQSASQSRYETRKRNTIRLTHQAFNNIDSSISQVKAGRQAVKSANSSLNSTQAAVNVGTRTTVDLLKAQKDMFEAQKELASYYYAYLINTLLLKQNSGSLNEQDIQLINKWLK